MGKSEELLGASGNLGNMMGTKKSNTPTLPKKKN